MVSFQSTFGNEEESMNSYGQYQNAYRKASVSTMDQTKLIVMLYDGAIKNLTIAVDRMQRGMVEETHKHLVKAKNIITELMLSLNLDKGGDIAKNLRSLYSFMFGQLIEANVQKDPAPAVEVIKLLKELRDAWTVIGAQNKSAPAESSQMGGGNAYGGMGGNATKRINLKG